MTRLPISRWIRRGGWLLIVVTILTGKVSDDYLAFLRSKGVSYLFGGDTEVDLRRVLERLRKDFGIKTLLVEGGGKINGSFLDADLMDEISVLVHRSQTAASVHPHSSTRQKASVPPVA